MTLALGLTGEPKEYASRVIRSGDKSSIHNISYAENEADALVGVSALVIGFALRRRAIGRCARQAMCGAQRPSTTADVRSMLGRSDHVTGASDADPVLAFETFPSPGPTSMSTSLGSQGMA